MGTASSKFKKYLQHGDEFAAMQVFQSSGDLKRHLDPNTSYGEHHNHNTPLHYASKHGMKHLLRTFLHDLGGNPNKRNAFNETVLHAACNLEPNKWFSAQERRAVCVSLILQWRGADLNNGGRERIDLQAQDQKGDTALHCAAGSGLKRCVELLLAHGSPLFVENNEHLTPCDVAVRAQHHDIAALLESRMVFADTNDTVNEAELTGGTEPDEVYSGLRTQDLQEAKDQLLVETSDMLHIPLFTAEALLRDNEWSRESLLDKWMKDPVHCCQSAGVQPPPSALEGVSSTFCLTRPMHFQTVVEESNSCDEQEMEGTGLEDAIKSPVRQRTHSLEKGPGHQDEEIECSICMLSVNTWAMLELGSMSCGHTFCSTCWENYLTLKIQEGDAHHISCPEYGCDILVPVEVIEKSVTPEVARRYLQFDIKAFVESSRSIKWCPRPGCGQAVRLPETEQLPPPSQTAAATSHAVDCGNGHFFCWECLGEVHAPSGCEQWQMWLRKIVEVKPEELPTSGVDMEDAANCLWLVTNSKPCPNCKSPIQKNEGCNHMKCSKCKLDFCWVCLEYWKKHSSSTGGYFRCNRFEASNKADERQGVLISEAMMRNQQATELSRFLHYYTRFRNHENSQKLEEPLLSSAPAKMALLAACIAPNRSPGDESKVEKGTQFVVSGVRELLKARRILCGSYVYGYYLQDNGYNKSIFEFMQNELEEVTEKLSEQIARPYLRTPRSLIIQTTALVRRKRHEFVRAVNKGLVPPETPPVLRKNRKRRFPVIIPELMSDQELTQAIAESLKDIDPSDPNWTQHVFNPNAVQPPDYDSDEEAPCSTTTPLTLCGRFGCVRPCAQNARNQSYHQFCSLRCSRAVKVSSTTSGDSYNLDMVIALEMSRLQMIEDELKRHAMQVPSAVPSNSLDASQSQSIANRPPAPLPAEADNLAYMEGSVAHPHQGEHSMPALKFR